MINEILFSQPTKSFTVAMKLALSSLYFVASAVALGPAGPGYCGESAIHCNLMRVPTSPISAAPNGTLVSGLELANGGELRGHQGCPAFTYDL